MKRVLFYVFIMMFISGCSFHTIVGASNEYALDITQDAQEYNSTNCKEYVLQVKNIDTYNPILSRSIYYSVGDYELFTYTKSNWQEAPFKSIKAAMIKSLRGTGIFKDVVSNRSSVEPDYVLEYSVENLMQYFDEDMNSAFVDVKIHFSFMNYKTSKLLYSTTIDKKIPSSSLDAIGGVKSISKALNDVIGENAMWLDGICQKEIK